MENGHDRRSAQRREEILATATEVFFAKGFSRTSIDDVLERIGGSKRTLYRHFPGKEALFTAIVTTFSDRASNFAPVTQSGELRPLLLELGQHYLENLLSKDVVAMFRMAVAEAPHFPEVTKVVYENGPKRACELLAKKFSEYTSFLHNGRVDPQSCVGLEPFVIDVELHGISKLSYGRSAAVFAATFMSLEV